MGLVNVRPNIFTMLSLGIHRAVSVFILNNNGTKSTPQKCDWGLNKVLDRLTN